MNTTNPLLRDQPLPAFEDIRPEHVEPAIRTLLERNRARIRAMEQLAEPSFANVVEPMEDLQHALTRAWSPVGHLNAVMNSEGLRESYNACLPLLSEYGTDIGQSEPLYRAYEKVSAREGASLDAVQRELLHHALRDFRLAGVALPAAQKERFKEVMLELSRLQAKFEENVLDATNHFRLQVTDATQLQGINATILEQARARAVEKGEAGWLFTLDQPTYVAIVTDGSSQELRRKFYEAWSTRASDRGPSAGRFDNSQIMQDILRLRHESARLLDFPSYAEYALATRMAKSTEEVLAFLRELARAARPAALREFAELTAFAGRKLDAWDVTYFSERLQQQRYSISQEALREYFPLPRVLQGLFEVVERLFDVAIVRREGVSVWHPDVGYYEIRNVAGEHIGSFYLDMYARAHKRSGAWMDECIGRKTTTSGSALPVAYLVCNALPPATTDGGDKPALLTHDDVVTVFHEFGHGIHHMLTRIGYPSIAGINGVSWDAVELPSQFLENYAWHPEVLGRISAHCVTGAPLPLETQRQLIATRSYQAGLQTLRQVEFALFDFRMHAEFDPASGGRIREILDEVRSEVAVVPLPEWNRYPHNFGHIFAGGYAAGYYSYKWAEVLAADAFAAFVEQGVFDRVTARRFLDSILSRGGSRDALEAFVEFRGRKPDIRPLLELHGIAA